MIEAASVLAIHEYANNMYEIGYCLNTILVRFIYMIIKSILSILVFLVFVVELIVLRGRIHQDLRILTALFKILGVMLMSFFLIEGIY